MIRGWLLAVIAMIVGSLVFAGVMWLLFPAKSATPIQSADSPAPSAQPAPAGRASAESSAVQAQKYQPTSPPPETPIPTNTPDGFTKAFYKWYLFEFANGLASTQNSSFMSSLANWASPEFITQYQNNKASPDETDPVLFAGDWKTSWPGNINTSIYSQNSTAAETIVILGTGNQVENIHISLSLTNQGWRITGIVPAA